MELFFAFLAEQWTLAGALLVTIALFFYGESRRSGLSLTPQAAINMVNSQGAVILDVRNDQEYKQGHVVDALSIPASKIESRIKELEAYRDKPVIIVCKMGQQSGSVGKQLRKQGFEQVYRMSGGMTEWSHMQLPLVSG